MTKHGTISRYTVGCRCARCRAANAEYQRAYQARRRADPKATFHFHVGGQPITKGQVHLIGEKGPERFVTASITQTAPGAWAYEVRWPLERTLDALVDACIDLREAFAGYYAAREEPIT